MGRSYRKGWASTLRVGERSGEVHACRTGAADSYRGSSSHDPTLNRAASGNAPCCTATEAVSSGTAGQPTACSGERQHGHHHHPEASPTGEVSGDNRELADPATLGGDVAQPPLPGAKRFPAGHCLGTVGGIAAAPLEVTDPRTAPIGAAQRYSPVPKRGRGVEKLHTRFRCGDEDCGDAHLRRSRSGSAIPRLASCSLLGTSSEPDRHPALLDDTRPSPGARGRPAVGEDRTAQRRKRNSPWRWRSRARTGCSHQERRDPRREQRKGAPSAPLSSIARRQSGPRLRQMPSSLRNLVVGNGLRLVAAGLVVGGACRLSSAGRSAASSTGSDRSTR